MPIARRVAVGLAAAIVAATWDICACAWSSDTSAFSRAML
jgi:hypothetical protein